MKKSGLFAVAFFLSLSSGARAADSFDQSIGDILETVETLKAPPQGGFGNHGGGDQHPGGGFNNGGDHGGHNVPQPPMPHPQPVNPGNDHGQPGNHGGNDNHGGFPGNDHNGPGNHGGNDNHGGFPGNDHNGPGNHGGNDNHGGFPGNNDWNNNHGGFPGNNDWNNNHNGNNDWNNQHPQPYHGPVNECTDFTFKADTPNPFSGKIYFYDYQGQIHDQKFSLNVGARDMKPWESEIITVCDGSVSQDKTLFNYSVSQKENSGFGSFFTGTKSYEYTMVPTGRKAVTPDGQGLDMVFGGATPNNTVAITIADKWASYYQGQQVTFNLKIMRMPKDIQNLPPQELLNALKETNISVTYPVSSQYQIQLFDQTLPGTYMVTVNYVRGGANLQQLFTFAI